MGDRGHAPFFNTLLTALDLRNEIDLAARPQRVVVADFMDLAVDGDAGRLLQMLAEAGIARVQRPDDIARALRLDLELLHAAGVAAAEAADEHDACGRPGSGLGHALILRPRDQ